MGIGPTVAILAAVKAAGLQVDDIDLFEINEAFASQFVYCQKKLELDPNKINVNGGAMAIGHPLGATGNFKNIHNDIIYWRHVIIVVAYRSPLCKSKRGRLKDTYPDDILAPVLKVESHRKAAVATAAGKFKDEIIPIKTKVIMVCSYKILWIQKAASLEKGDGNRRMSWIL